EGVEAMGAVCGRAFFLFLVGADDRHERPGNPTGHAESPPRECASPPGPPAHHERSTSLDRHLDGDRIHRRAVDPARLATAAANGLPPRGPSVGPRVHPTEECRLTAYFGRCLR